MTQDNLCLWDDVICVYMTKIGRNLQYWDLN